jgi:hypothetical protein
MAKRRAEVRASDKGRKAKRSRSPRGMASLPRQIWGDVKLYGWVFSGVAAFLGVLGLSWLANVSIIAVSMLVVFIIRYESTLLILKRLYIQSAFYASLYAVILVVVVAIVAYSAFLVGKQAGYTSGVRRVLTSLNIPTRPLPPPRPRFPGDLDLDEYCRSEGPYQVMAPTDLGIVVQFEGQPPRYAGPAYSEEQMRELEAHFGKDFLLCGSRIRQPSPSTGESEGVFFRVNDACAWQYPGKHVKAIPPSDRRYIDQWRCQLASGPPATWP